MRQRVWSEPVRLADDEDSLDKHIKGLQERLGSANGEQTLLSTVGVDFPLSLPMWALCLQELRQTDCPASSLSFTLALAQEIHSSSVSIPSLEPLGFVLHGLVAQVERVEVSPVWLQSLSGQRNEVKAVLFLLEICLERMPEVSRVIGRVGPLVLQRMEKLLRMLGDWGSKDLEELYLRLAMTLASYIALIFPSHTDTASRLFAAFQALVKLISSSYQSLFDLLVPEITHNYWTCRHKCRLCTGTAVSFRYALAACFTRHSNSRLNEVTRYAGDLMLEGLQVAGLATQQYLDYVGLYVHIEKPVRKPSRLVPTASSLLALYCSLDSNALQESLFPKMPSAPALIAHLFTYISLDSPVCVSALVVLISGCQSPDQQLFSYTHLRGLVLASADSRASASKAGLGETVLERSEWVQPVREMIGQLALTPATVAGFIQRVNRALRAVPREVDTATSLLTVLITAIRAGETSAFRAIKSLGGLRIFLPALRIIGTEEEHCNALKIGILKVVEAGKELMDEDFAEMLSLALEESGQGLGFDEETVILLLGLFSDHQSKFPQSKHSVHYLLFTPNLWQGLSHPLYQFLIFPIQLSCFAQVTASEDQKLKKSATSGEDQKVKEAEKGERFRQYGCVLLAEINRRQSKELDENLPEIIKLLKSYIDSVKSPASVCDLLYLALKALPENPQFAIDICNIVREALSSPLFTEQSHHEELVAILKAFKPWLELEKGISGSELGPRLVQVLVDSTKSSRVMLLGLTGKFSVKTGFDDEQLNVLRDLAVVIDWEAYKTLCIVWPHRDPKNPKWLYRTLLLADLVPRSKGSCLLQVWKDFSTKLLGCGEVGRLQSAENYSPRWLVDVFDGLVESDPTVRLDYKREYWDIVVQMLKSADSYDALRRFVREFWSPEKPQRKEQLQRILVSCLFPKNPTPSKELLFHFLLSLEDCLHQHPSLTPSLFPLLHCTLSPFAPLSPPFPRARPLPIISYEEVFTQNNSPSLRDSSVGGLRRVIVSLVLLGLKAAEDLCNIEDFLQPVLECRAEGKGSEDLFASEGFLEAYLVTELLVWTYEEKDGPALSILMRLSRHFIHLSEKVQSFLEETLPSYQSYHTLLCKHYQSTPHQEPAFDLVDSMQLRQGLGLWPGVELEFSEEDFRGKMGAFRDRIPLLLEALEESTAREVISDPRWQEAVFLYLITNTRMRLRPYLARSEYFSPTDPASSSFPTTDPYIPIISEVEKTQNFRRAYGRARWKAICKQLKGVYGLWSSPSSGQVLWKVANHVDMEGKRTRIKRKNNGTRHEYAILRKNKPEIVRSVTSMPKFASSVPESPMTEPSSASSLPPSFDLDPPRPQEEPRSPTSLPCPCERITCLYALYGLLDLTKDYFSYRSCKRPMKSEGSVENAALVSGR